MCALESSAVLLNEIIAMHKALKPGTRPSRFEVTELFHRYQEERKPRMQEEFDASALITRLQAFDGPMNHLIMRYIFPIQGCEFYADKLGELCSTAPRIKSLPVRYPHPASILWKDEAIPLSPDKKESVNLLAKINGDGLFEVVFNLFVIIMVLAVG